MNESPLTSSLLTPMLALICWSLVMLVWLYATRIPAMGKAKVDPANAQEPSALDALPLAVRQVGYNYNHLMEQPTIFYALVVYSYLAGQQNGPNLILAWLYVALRIVHSLVQATVNLVLVRFGIFALASVVLAILAARDVWALVQAA
jgi:hypothetical protein